MSEIINEELGITYNEVDSLDITPIGLGAWSFSKLKVLNKCPFQFYLKYVLKAKGHTAAPISIVTETGKAAHKILELVVMGKSIEDSFRQVRKEYADILPGSLWDEGDGHDKGGVGRTEYSITKFKERLDIFEKLHPVKRYITELRIGVTKDWEATGFFTNNPENTSKDVFFRGVIDLTIQLENKDVVFLDHKFGVPAVVGIRNFQEQLDIYKVLFSKGIEPYNNAQSGVHFIRDGEIVLGNMTSKSDIENTLPNRVNFSIQGAIDKVKELGYFKHIMGSSCQYCDFKEVCKAGKLKFLEKDSKELFLNNK